ncbi:MAG: hypothetical protein NE327_21585 [Lentisphaeraceae bacterium]|nr:hypothetical protein [Lentisphaeraceae bacterium]
MKYKFSSAEQAEVILENTLSEINEILERDLQHIHEEMRNVDRWFQEHGKNSELDFTKDTLRKLEMKAIDAEIYLLDLCDKRSRLSETVS